MEIVLIGAALVLVIMLFSRVPKKGLVEFQYIENRTPIVESSWVAKAYRKLPESSRVPVKTTQYTKERE